MIFTSSLGLASPLRNARAPYSLLVCRTLIRQKRRRKSIKAKKGRESERRKKKSLSPYSHTLSLSPSLTHSLSLPSNPFLQFLPFAFAIYLLIFVPSSDFCPFLPRSLPCCHRRWPACARLPRLVSHSMPRDQARLSAALSESKEQEKCHSL